MRSVGDIILAGFSQLKNARIENLAADPASPQAGQVWYNTTDGAYRGFNGSAIITFATGGSTAVLLQEIDNIETAVGLNSDGTFSAPSGANYIGSASSVVDAESKLDAALKATSDAVASETARATSAEGTLTTNLAAEVTRAKGAEQTLTTNLAAEVTRATTAEGTLTTNLAAEVTRAQGAEGLLTTSLGNEVTRAQDAEGVLTTNLAAEVTRATGAEQTLTDNLAAEVTRAQGAEGVLTTNLAAEVTRATGAETALDTRVQAVEASYVKKDGSVAFIGDQSMGSNKLIHVATPVDGTDAANKAYVDNKITALGNAFSYVGTLTGGADAANAFDLSGLAQTQAGAFYKVTTSGYFKVGAGDAFYVNASDCLVFNIDGAADKIDNTDSQVQGTANFISVAGSADTGFVVDVDEAFKVRVNTLESDMVAEVTRATTAEGTLTTNLNAEVARATAAEGVLTTNLGAEVVRAKGAEQTLTNDLAAEVTRATGAEQTLTTNLSAEVSRAQTAEGTLTTNLAAEVTRAKGAEGTLTTNLGNEVSRATTAEGVLTTNLAAEVTRATGVEGALQTEIDAIEAAVGLTEAGAFTALTGTNYLDAASTIVALSQALDVALKALADRVNASTFVYNGSTAQLSHTVTHNLGQKYCQVTVVDSADKVILADSIQFVDSNSLTVDFSSAITCRVIVTAVKQ